MLIVSTALFASPACEVDHALLLPAGQSVSFDADGFTLVARFAHITDTHSLDEESPARFPGSRVITPQAWRPYEAYSTQLFDGIIRGVNRIHAAGKTINFLIHTGDTCDNAQSNELAWFLSVG